MESIWMKCLALHLCLEVVFPLRKQYYQEVLFNLMEKNKTKLSFAKINKMQHFNKF
jgi:hypothetical protein